MHVFLFYSKIVIEYDWGSVELGEGQLRFPVEIGGYIRMDNNLEKPRKKLSDACDIGEFTMGVVVVGGIVVGMIGLVPDFVTFWQNRSVPGAFMEFLGRVSLIVIGIEFAKMLCKPTTANIIEVLIFVISRQMIIDHQPPEDMLKSVIAICLLFLFRRIMLVTRPDEVHHHVPNILKALRLAQTKEFRKAMEELEEGEVNKEVEEQKEEEPDMNNFWED